MSLFACTGAGVVRVDRDGGAWTAEPVLEDVDARCVAVAGPRVLVGTRGDGALASEDAGATWERIGLPERDIFSVAFGAADGARYAGSEPSRVFVARDGGPWTELEALQDVPSRHTWSFPPRPWTHHVRWIAPDPRRAERLLVGIELGGVLLSEDGGASFSDHRPGARRDTHELLWHPTVPDRAYQAAGDGAAWTRDGGRTWEAADAGRDLRYCWAVAADPGDPDRWYVSAASGPGAAHAGAGARGRLYRWEDGTWRTLDPPGESMPYALAASGGALVAGMTNGRLLRSTDDGASWEEAGLDLGGIVALAGDREGPAGTL